MSLVRSPAIRPGIDRSIAAVRAMLALLARLAIDVLTKVGIRHQRRKSGLAESWAWTTHGVILTKVRNHEHRRRRHGAAPVHGSRIESGMTAARARRRGTLPVLMAGHGCAGMRNACVALCSGP
jgi:hypothetical protein